MTNLKTAECIFNSMIDKLLKARVDDALRLGKKSPKFIGFLDPAEAADVAAYVNVAGSAYMFFGGYEGAERLVLGVFPMYIEPSAELFPVAPITLEFKSEYPLSHRDFLGAFMAQGIERSTVGDILIEPGRCVAFIRDEISDYFLQNIAKIGRVGVRLKQGFGEPLPGVNSFEEKSGVIASPRLDCVVSFLSGKSREKSSTAILGGRVFLNYREAGEVSKPVSEGDIVTIRSEGKFIVDTLGPNTKKGRLIIKCRKYK